MEPRVVQIFSSAKSTEGNAFSDLDDPMDILVYLDNGEQYIASFITYVGVEKIYRKNQKNGENLSGAYFWSKHLILVRDCKLETVERIVEHLIEEGEFRVAFEKV